MGRLTDMERSADLMERTASILNYEPNEEAGTKKLDEMMHQISTKRSALAEVNSKIAEHELGQRNLTEKIEEVDKTSLALEEKKQSIITGFARGQAKDTAFNQVQSEMTLLAGKKESFIAALGQIETNLALANEESRELRLELSSSEGTAWGAISEIELAKAGRLIRRAFVAKSSSGDIGPLRASRLVLREIQYGILGGLDHDSDSIRSGLLKEYFQQEEASTP